MSDKKSLKNRFQQFEPDVSVQGWEQIENKLPARKKSVWKWLAAAFFALCVIGGSVYFLKDTKKPDYRKDSSQNTPALKNPIKKQQEKQLEQPGSLTNKTSERTLSDNTLKTQNSRADSVQIIPAKEINSQLEKMPETINPVENISAEELQLVITDSAEYQKGQKPKVEIHAVKKVLCFKEQAKVVIKATSQITDLVWLVDNEVYLSGKKPLNQIDTVSFKELYPGTHAITCQYNWKDSVYSSVQTIKILPLPKPDFNYTIDEERFIPVLQAEMLNVSNTNQVSWFLDGQEISGQKSIDVEITRNGEHTITLIAEDENGCKNRKTEKFETNISLNAPNAFSPNGDGINDTWMPLALKTNPDIKFQLKVVDAQGKQVFYSTNPFNEWDGNIPGKNYSEIKGNIYIWYAIVYLPNGEKMDFGGSVTIL